MGVIGSSSNKCGPDVQDQELAYSMLVEPCLCTIRHGPPNDDKSQADPPLTPFLLYIPRATKANSSPQLLFRSAREGTPAFTAWEMKISIIALPSGLR